VFPLSLSGNGGKESKSFLSFRLPFQILSYICVIDQLMMNLHISIPFLGGVAFAPAEAAPRALAK
jgi:hypothetical protein